LPTRLVRFVLVPAVLAGLSAASPAPAAAQPPTFRSGVDLVSVTAVARDDHGRPVRDLAREDFEVYEQGRLRRLTDFKVSDQGPVSLAILMDASGSMRVGAQLDASRRAVEHVLSWVQPDADEVSLFSFDRELRQEVPFTKDLAAVRTGLYKIEALGQTSLYDAIGQTARTLGDRPSPRRAVIVITDGLDTSSTLTPSEVSGLASAIDVPVYVIAVLSPLDHPGTEFAVPSAAESPVSTHLSNLAYWTGGTLIMSSTPAHASQAARLIIAELRHQYLLAFEASSTPGWYALEVRTRRKNVNVRARSGYFAAGAEPAVPTSWGPSSRSSRAGSQ
jgi:Ca-activated chloride channel family protein